MYRKKQLYNPPLPSDIHNMINVHVMLPLDLLLHCHWGRVSEFPRTHLMERVHKLMVWQYDMIIIHGLVTESVSYVQIRLLMLRGLICERRPKSNQNRSVGTVPSIPWNYICQTQTLVWGYFLSTSVFFPDWRAAAIQKDQWITKYTAAGETHQRWDHTSNISTSCYGKAKNLLVNHSRPNVTVTKRLRRRICDWALLQLDIHDILTNDKIV